ncbi:Srf1 protein [Saccharomycopsis crataegensis]|uniref:Srf1 protein n=1 Tax=Saccharomycopsis crataegensis TaxID=43959 RepID=A0AAV5QJZ8_9ASCO|nr:Srf1 protein [Saccharomycopsis crataegensis]
MSSDNNSKEPSQHNKRSDQFQKSPKNGIVSNNIFQTAPQLPPSDSQVIVNVPHSENLDRLNVYNLEATVIPPYVLDSVGKAQFSQQSQNTESQGGDYRNYVGNNEVDLSTLNNTSNNQNDLFLSSINNNWNQFLDTIESKSSNLVKNKIISLDYRGDGRHNNDEPPSKQPGTSKSLANIDEKDSVNLPSSSIFEDSSASEYKLPDLSGPWEGDERLRKVLNQDVYAINGNSEGFANAGFTNWFNFSKSKDGETDNKKHHLGRGNNDYSPKIRSSAKYWMSTEQRTRWKPWFKQMFLFNPYLLVALRSIMLVLCVVALGLAVSIYKNSQEHNDIIQQQPSTIMAIVVQSVASVYLIYVAYDEYNGKPVGLRDPMGKLKLILLDLLFIIFSAANLSLAYNTLYDDRWVCVDDKGSVSDLSPRENDSKLTTVAYSDSVVTKVSTICDKQRALSAFLFFTLVMWVFTFSISIFRVVDRVASPKS